MAEAVVGLLIGKLAAALANQATAYGASLLCKEASALNGLFGEIRKAEKELESMKAYLRESEKFKDTDENTGIFLKNIRELSFRIEDVVDEFMYKLVDDKHGGFVGRAKKRIKHIKVWRRLAIELHDINVELEETTKRRDRYVIPGMQRYSESANHHANSTNQTSFFAKEEDLVGIEHNAAKLKWWLVGDLEERKRKIITVWGMGGVGKTTLVNHVYKIVKADFDASAWITVSKSYHVEDMLKTIAREFGIPIGLFNNMDMRRLVEFIRNHLEGKRYIIVLDDVWEQDVWTNNVMPVFPTNCTSRFVLTSRLYEVASLATSNCAIELEPLQDNYSYQLFCKLAFWNNDEKWCPAELLDLATKFLQKCEGLPIAIACISRLLCCKTPIYAEWKNVYEKLELQSAENTIPGVDNILKVSLEDLPCELKNCFLHCALFPEDCEMKRRRLIRHWIASGFIKEKVNQTLEQVAESYLNDLANRSLLQVVRKNEFGRVKSCRMHDVIRHLATEKAMKECFGEVYDAHEIFSVHGTRRLSIHSTNIAPVNKSGATHLRAIYAFTSSVDIDWVRPILESSIMLSILDLEGCSQIKVLPNVVFSLFNLRFLGLRYTSIEILPEAIGRLHNLEILDAAATGLVSLPKDVAKLRKLRYLYAFRLHTENTRAHFFGVKVPWGIRHLTGLHALQRVRASLETLCEVAALKELRTFAVTGVTNEHCLNLCSAIMNMSHLSHLSVDAGNENEVLPLEALRLPETLYKLELTGQLEKTQIPQIFSSWSHHNNLSILNLTSSKFNEDSFSCLVTLRGLCCLDLSSAYDGKTMCFPAQSFPRLQTLSISCAWQLSQIEIEEGALESLVELWFLDCPELKHLPHGIEYITTLEELYLFDTAEELIEKLCQDNKLDECNEELLKISNIRKVVVRLTQKNLWERIL